MRRLSLVLALAPLACSTTEHTVFDAGEPADAQPPPDGACTVFCKANQPAVIDVSCMTAKVTSTTLGGVCAPDAGGGAGLSCLGAPNAVPFVDCDPAFVFANAAGDCDVSLQFDDGFAYSATVHFTAEPGTYCCPQTLFIPSPASLAVDELDASCAPDAADASPD
ncbi:MAG TPA: hypothetical protein VLM85_15665 [Polyangiaceae bacterium]|nr:hypothetical protein [Polyangiaceae bacterium]